MGSIPIARFNFFFLMEKMQFAVKEILVLGDGAWGTTLAILLARKGFSLKIWCPSKENANLINTLRENKKYLPGVILPDNIIATNKLELLDKTELVILALPSRFVAELIKTIIKSSKNWADTAWCIATKGIDFRTYETMSQLINRFLSPKHLAVISGPAIAREVVLGFPTALVVAGQNQEFAKGLQQLFCTEFLRIYRSSDVIGVEVGASLKNVIAIAAGICDGLGLGTNSKSALLTRGIAEMSRFAEAVGGRPQTIYGISGLADLMTTAFSPFSRNRSFGEAIGKGEDPQELLERSTKAIEGAFTVKAVVEMAKRFNIEMPISKEVYNVVFNSKSAKKALFDLMQRPLKSED